MTPQSPPGSTPPAQPQRTTRHSNLPLLTAILLLGICGALLLIRADQQARDTIRKHHLADIEQALYTARNQHGSYPPYAETTWCGRLETTASAPIRKQIEAALRAQNEKYANPAKPFPADPRTGSHPTPAATASGAAKMRNYSYFYWKHSPASFELFAMLEAAPTGERSTTGCPGESAVYDYGIASIWRESNS
ncbi:MAG: hypothetical protein COT71_03655 [Candidatus Andersenbacteria bacterium CG10_big_fil_rev_8_21_14_0_10_54_11]|uniref:Type II secretion system protein GspG C-terminal domain-containing protein n=1 Tax=Candidatus Andersenbacteria bacterium CG10_big_fil_rev_8_21_14_0_10_54_11 TaxID=1974485 RepID=A0A2M6WYL0_9BACT|nr:MAG: hypothetical protein COT71_03655 [Candidatus Andersenbacteria bacterium CG10_big_fil_rev_8_21_14_0_10_54_11]